MGTNLRRIQRKAAIGDQTLSSCAGLLGALVLFSASALGEAPALAATPQLPDLVADAPVGGNQPTVDSDASGDRLLLRFDGFVHNGGPGRLEIRGTAPSGGLMGTVRQRVYDDAGGFADRAHSPSPTLIYETNDDHDHWHLRNAMRYSLQTEDGAAEAGPAQKVGFCLLDSEPIEAPADQAPTYTADSHGFCRTGQPETPSVFMGISPGWRDIYSYVLAFQWVDISDVAPGRYRLRAEADPDGVIAEAREDDPAVLDSDLSIVNGYRADPVDAGTVPETGREITLSATRFDDVHEGSPGPRQFRIVVPPAGGTLDRPAGTWFSAATVRYTPRPGFSGADTFTVAARDATSPFPRDARGAAVTLRVAAPGPGPAPGPDGPAPPGVLGISGAPASVATASTTRLSATGPGVERGITWNVDGADGGTPRSGTITAAGVYRAPSSVPPGGSVRISARTPTGAAGHISLGIRKSAQKRPAPTVAAPRVPRRGLSAIRLGRHGRSLIAVVSSARTGRVRFYVRRRGTRIGFCSMIVARGGAATCRVKVSETPIPRALLCTLPRTRGLNLPGVTVQATLTRQGRVLASRRATAR